ncbi:MAG: hypothetical protein ACE5FC_05805, partial [Myxococcota bacterium]
YRFPYNLFVDGEKVYPAAAGGLSITRTAGSPSGHSYLPRSGRQSIITRGYALPADGRAHSVRVVLNPEVATERLVGVPERWPPESDYTNNDMTRTLRREVQVRLRLNFGEFLVLGDGDRRSSGELKQLKVRLCREGGGCSPRAEAYARDRAIGRGGLIFSNPLSIDSGDLITGRFSHDPLEVTGGTVDRYFIEVYAYEDDGFCFFANCDDWGTLKLHFSIPARMRTGLPETCGDANTFAPALEDRRSGEVTVEYQGPGRGPKIEPTRSTVCVFRTY